MIAGPSNPIAPAPVTRCWSEIGVWGNHSCPELKQWIHCHNCPVFSRAGRSLFEQAPPQEYLNEWTRLIADEQGQQRQDQTSVLVFRLGTEWFALETASFREVEEVRRIHRIPHRTNKVLLGLVNIRGGLQLIVSLQELLGLAAEPGARPGPAGTRTRFAVMEKGGACWVFPVDEILGVVRFAPADVQPLPVTIAKAAAAFTKGILLIDNKKAGYLDEELLLFHLKRSLL